METELILNPDGSVYHLGLLPGQGCRLVLTVGDPDRVELVSRHFDTVTLRQRRREFAVHLGTLAGRPVTCISTGIGTDNVDIVVQELDALLNVDFSTRKPREDVRSIAFVRLGTSGTLQADVPIDALVASQHALGLDGLGPFYPFPVHPLAVRFGESFPELAVGAYAASADSALLDVAKLMAGVSLGNALTCAGFYGPQRRSIRLDYRGPSLADLAAWRGRVNGAVDATDLRLDNLEMETAGLYGLARLLGHKAISFNAILANRSTGEFSARPSVAVDRMIELVLEEVRSKPRVWWPTPD